MFSKRCFSEWCVQKVVRIRKGREGTKMLEKTGVFRHSSSLWRGLPLSEAEVRNLKNTVWKTPFGTLRFLGCAKGAEKVSCGETVVQKGGFGESVSSLPPWGLLLKHPKSLRGQRRNGLSKSTLLGNRLSAPLARSEFHGSRKGDKNTEWKLSNGWSRS